MAHSNTVKLIKAKVIPVKEPDSFRRDTSACCTNSLGTYVLYFNVAVPSTFSFSVSSFWFLTSHNKCWLPISQKV